MLDLKNEVERDTEKFLRRACSGRWPIWRLLGMQRHGNILAAAVEWLRCGDTVYALVEMALDKPAVHWRYFPTADAACSALATFDAQAQQGQPATPAAPTALKLK